MYLHFQFFNFQASTGEITMQELITQLREDGYNFNPVLDGNIHRFPTGKDKGAEKSGWLVGFKNITKQGSEFIVAKYSDYRRADVREFQSDIKLSAREKKVFDEDIKKAEELAKEERRKLQELTAEQAQAYLKICSDNLNVDYLERKNLSGSLYGAKSAMDRQGRCLVIPLLDIDGKLWTTQTISSDGFKQFQKGGKKSGSFHVIPNREALEGAPEIFIVEGFSTGASVYKAVDKPVVVACDTSNLRPVGKALATKYPDAALIFCADDDGEVQKPDGTYWNPGVESAETAAAKCGGQVIIPKFKSKGNLSDFNDLHLSEGLKALKAQILGIEIKKVAKLRPLGWKGDNYYFISSQKPAITALNAASMGNHLNLLRLIHRPYWERVAPKPPDGRSPETVDWKGAAEKLIAVSNLRYFDEKKVRASGVWRDKGRVVINSGEGLMVDGEACDFDDLESEYIYTHTSSGCELPIEAPATAEEMQEIALILESLPWKEKHYAYFLMGWMFIAPICGVLNWRPHLWMTAPRGAGKSWIQDNIVSVLTRNATAFLGGTTEAGIRQSLASSAIPVIYDEAEKNDEASRKKIQRVIELFRLASSETNARTVKGSATGESMEYIMKFCGIMSSINVSLELAQDISRFTVLELELRRDDGFEGKGGIRQRTSEKITEDMGRKMYSRAVAMRDVLDKNTKTVQKAINGLGKGSRFTDQMAPLIAGYLTATDDKPVSLEYVENFALPSLFGGLAEEAEEAEESDSQRDCITHLLTSTYPMNGEHKSFEYLISLAYKERLDRTGTSDSKPTALEMTLMSYGMKVTRKNNDMSLYLSVCKSHKKLAEIFNDTEWSRTWEKTMMRIDGAHKSKDTFITTSPRTVKIPIAYIFGND